MAITNYSGAVPTFIQLLGGLKGVLSKLEAHATERKWDQTVVLNTRFYPDMFTLERQVRQACVHAQGAGRVAGAALPSLPDQRQRATPRCRRRIDKVIDFNKGLSAVAGRRQGRQRSDASSMGGNERKFKAQTYLYHTAMPNFYFHITTAYNIVRSLGVEIGKRDFMGQAPS